MSEVSAASSGPKLVEFWSNSSVVGRAACRAASDLVDAWVAELHERASAGHKGSSALVAVGGYGRRELSPGSDLDLLLLHDGGGDIEPVAESTWYPIWDTGIKLGHAVRTVKEALKLASDDLDTATSLLNARHVAGDESLCEELHEKAVDQWRRKAKRMLPEMAERTDARHAAAGEVAFLLEPDLKEGRGGLRDVHGVRWAQHAMPLMLDLADETAMTLAYDVLLGARVELHRVTGKANDRLLLEDQDAVAAALGEQDADALMANVSSAARTIAWISDDTWRRMSSAVSSKRRRSPQERDVGPGLRLVDDEIVLHATLDRQSNPNAVLDVAAAAARENATIERRSLERLETSAADFGLEPWPAGARELLVDALLCGVPAIEAFESLDRRGLLGKVLPEWDAVRCKPQRNAYHQFTVDRHLLEAAANSAALADRVTRPDLLVVGTLLHDIGKGFPGDHTDVGIDLVRDIGTRMGFSGPDVETLCAMVKYHLLLPDVATRRDLDDPATIAKVAEQVGDVVTLELLWALTEADSLATGPAAWGSWKAALVEKLATRTRHVLDGGDVGDVADADQLSDDVRVLLEAGDVSISHAGRTLTVVAPDEPGLFARLAGALSLAGAAVRTAQVHSVDGMICDEFTLVPAQGELDWDRIEGLIADAIAGRLAIEARLAARANTYDRRKPQGGESEPSVRFDNAMSDDATVVEVHAADSTGFLYRVAKTLTELGLDIRSARVQTLGPNIVDAFYVTDKSGGQVTDLEHRQEIEHALAYVLRGNQ